MKKLHRLFFVLGVVFSTSTCFAGELEEQRELMTIVKPIVHQIDPLKSSTRLISAELMKRQVASGRQINFSDDQVNAVIMDMRQKQILSSDTAKKIHDIDALDRQCREADLSPTSTSQFAHALLLSWDGQVAKCGGYVNMALAIFEFNQMNREKLKGEKVFKEAVILTTHPGSGEHQVLLVEDMHKTVFLVDPWLKHVRKLEHFPSLDKIREYSNEAYKKRFGGSVSQYEQMKVYPLMSDMPNGKLAPDLELNSRYRDKHTGYYDGYYVKEDTRWVLQVATTKRIQEFVRTKNKDMKDFYIKLRPLLPQWVKEYNDLFPGRGAVPIVIPVENVGAGSTQPTVPATVEPVVTYHPEDNDDAEGKK